MSGIYFTPWKGEHYEESPLFGKRVLVLGEAHYDTWDGERHDLGRDFTIRCVKDQTGGAYTRAFWTKVAETFLGKKPTLEEKGKFWNSVAFYNFIQEAVHSGSRTAPLEESWRRSEGPFREVLADLRPQLVVALGERLWKNMPAADGSGPSVERARMKETRRYSVPGGGSCLAYGIYHPSSSRFSLTEWHRAVMAALKLA
jgi:hypothetical protein